jgi:hypothetical protein
MNEKSRNYNTATNKDDKNNEESITEQVTATVKDKTQPVDKTQLVKEKATELLNETKPMVDEASHQAKSALSEQKDAAVDQLSGLAKALRQSSDQLRQQDQGAFATYSQQVADQIDHMSGYLRDRDLEDLMYDAEDFARRQPELFIGGAFTLGLLAARFLKSSTPDAHQRRTYETHRRNRSYSTSHLRENDRSEREEGVTNPTPSMRNISGTTPQRRANGY